jgi:3-oxoacyl-[acyl-carrier-protein] synthase-1
MSGLVLGLGMACPLGLRVRSALAAVEAGISPFIDRDDVLAPGGPPRVAMLDEARVPPTRSERAAFFARHAIREALGEHVPTTRPLATILALPAPGIGPRIDPRALLDALPGAPLVLHAAVEEGRASTFAALDLADDLLARGREPLVLVLAADSLVDAETLRSLGDHDRLLGRTNRDGILPGEGAACLLLGLASQSRRPLARIHALALAREVEPFVAAGTRVGGALALTDVFRSLLHEVDARVDEVFVGATGQVYFAREFSHAYLRNVARMPEPLRTRLLADALGDVGAAAGAMAAVHAIMRLSPTRWAPANRMNLVYAASDEGLVGGCVMVPP